MSYKIVWGGKSKKWIERLRCKARKDEISIFYLTKGSVKKKRVKDESY